MKFERVGISVIESWHYGKRFIPSILYVAPSLLTVAVLKILCKISICTM